MTPRCRWCGSADSLDGLQLCYRPDCVAERGERRWCIPCRRLAGRWRLLGWWEPRLCDSCVPVFRKAAIRHLTDRWRLPRAAVAKLAEAFGLSADEIAAEVAAWQFAAEVEAA